MFIPDRASNRAGTCAAIFAMSPVILLAPAAPSLPVEMMVILSMFDSGAAMAMNVKAEAYQEYNQAAVVDKLITGLPEVVRALSEPLSKVDKVTIVSTGDNGAAGAYKLTGDVTKIAAQVPALFEALSGMQMSDLLSKVRLIGDKAPRPEQPPLPAPKKQ